MKRGFFLYAIAISLAAFVLPSSTALGKTNRRDTAAEAIQHTSEAQIRNMLEPILDRYCRDECRLMSVNVTVDFSTPDQVAPGFDDIDPRSSSDLAPSSAKIKLLIDEQIGPISRGKLLDLIQQYLDTLDYPVKVDTQVSRFPQPVGSMTKAAELREQVTKQFAQTLDGIFRTFCPDKCLLADYELKTDPVNPEEAQYGRTGEFIQDTGIALKIVSINGTILVDESLTPDERANILEMAKLKTNFFKNVNLQSKALKFPHPNAGENGSGTLIEGNGLPGSTRTGNRTLSSDKQSLENKSQSTDVRTQATTQESKDEQKNRSTTEEKSSSVDQKTEKNDRQEKFERYEKIERVENGDAVQSELRKFKIYGLALSLLFTGLLVAIVLACYRPARSASDQNILHRVSHVPSPDADQSSPSESSETPAISSRQAQVGKRYEIQRLIDELMKIYAEQPYVAKQVFSRILAEEGLETTAQYIDIFGESVVIEMLRDPSMASDVTDLMEFFARNTFEQSDDEKLDLLRKLNNRTMAGKLVVMGRRTSNLFDFLVDMDSQQIHELVRNESLTVKSIVLTQCDPQKRAQIYNQVDDNIRMQLLSELSRIDYLPRDYIFNVANALKRKRTENPRLNTEALPGTDVLLTLMERSSSDTQRMVMRNLELSNPEGARMIKAKLVCSDTLRFLRDGQLLEVVLSLKHEELIQFLKGASSDVRQAIYQKSPKDLMAELEDELAMVQPPSREVFLTLERKLMSRIKLMVQDGLINLNEVNDRMFATSAMPEAPTSPPPGFAAPETSASLGKNLKKAGGW